MKLVKWDINASGAISGPQNVYPGRALKEWKIGVSATLLLFEINTKYILSTNRRAILLKALP